MEKIGYRPTCFFCAQQWGGCECMFPEQMTSTGLPAEIAEDEGFDHDGDFISEPNVSECGRFYVDPIVYYGAPFVAWWKKHGREQQMRRNGWVR